MSAPEIDINWAKCRKIMAVKMAESIDVSALWSHRQRMGLPTICSNSVMYDATPNAYRSRRKLRKQYLSTNTHVGDVLAHWQCTDPCIIYPINTQRDRSMLVVIFFDGVVSIVGLDPESVMGTQENNSVQGIAISKGQGREMLRKIFTNIQHFCTGDDIKTMNNREMDDLLPSEVVHYIHISDFDEEERKTIIEMTQISQEHAIRNGCIFLWGKWEERSFPNNLVTSCEESSDKFTFLDEIVGVILGLRASIRLNCFETQVKLLATQVPACAMASSPKSTFDKVMETIGLPSLRTDLDMTIRRFVQNYYNQENGKQGEGDANPLIPAQIACLDMIASDDMLFPPEGGAFVVQRLIMDWLMVHRRAEVLKYRQRVLREALQVIVDAQCREDDQSYRAIIILLFLNCLYILMREYLRHQTK